MYNEIEIKYFSQKNNSGGKKMNSQEKNLTEAEHTNIEMGSAEKINNTDKNGEQRCFT